MFPPRLELRFHQDNNVTSISLLGSLRKRGVNHSGQHKGGRDERNIHRNEIHRLAKIF